MLLVFGVVLYIYSPLLDHWLDNDHYIRPHTHIHLSENILTNVSTQNHREIEGHFSENSDHEENILCMLDIKTLIYALLNVNAVLIVENVPLIFDLFPYYMQGSTVYLPLLDPPPRIYA